MGWGFRKSKKILPGVRATLSHRGLGFRLGSRHAGVSVTPTGARVSGSIPGTGVSFRKELRGSKNSDSAEEESTQTTPMHITRDGTLEGFWLNNTVRLPGKVKTPGGSQISIITACVDIDYRRDGYAIQIADVRLTNADPNVGAANTGELFRLDSLGNATLLIEAANRDLHDENLPLRRCILGHSYNLPNAKPSKIMSAILLPIYLVGFLVCTCLALVLFWDASTAFKIVGGVFALLALVCAANAAKRLKAFW